MEALGTRPVPGRTPSGRSGSSSTPLESDIDGVEGVGELLRSRDFLRMARPNQSSVLSNQRREVPGELQVREVWAVVAAAALYG